MTDDESIKLVRSAMKEAMREACGDPEKALQIMNRLREGSAQLVEASRISGHLFYQAETSVKH